MRRPLASGLAGLAASAAVALAAARAGDPPAADPDAVPPGVSRRLGTPRFQLANVWSLAVSPDGKTLAAGGQGVLKLFDAATGRETRRLDAKERVTWLAFSPDGKALAAGSLDKSITLWEVAKGKEARRLQGNDQPITQLAWSPDGKYLAAGDQGASLVLYRTSDGKVVRKNPGEPKPITDFMSCAFSPDSKLLATSMSDRSIRIWEVASGKEKAFLKGHSERGSSVAFAPDGKTLYSAAFDDTVRAWDVKTATEAKQAKVVDVRYLALAPDGKTLAVRSRNQVVRFLATDGLAEKGRVEDLREHGDTYFEFSPPVFFPDGKLVATGSFGTVRVFDIATGKDARPRKGHEGPVNALAFSPDGKTLASVGIDCWLHLWDPATGEERRGNESHFEQVNDVAWSRDGKRVASASNDETARVWDAETAKETKRHEGLLAAHAVAFSWDSKRVAASTERKGTVVFDVETGSEAFKAGEHGFALAFSERELVVAGPGGFRRHDAGTGAQTGRCGHPGDTRGFALSPDGRLVAAPAGKGVLVVELASGKEAKRIDTPGVHRVAFTPNGKGLATCGQGDVRLFDLASGKEVKRVECSKDELVALAIAPDGRSLATAGADSVISIVEVKEW